VEIPRPSFSKERFLISEILKKIFDGAILPALFAAMAIQFPIVGVILKIPVLGAGIKKVTEWAINWLIDKGVIGLKDGLLNLLSEKAKADYAPMIDLLREAQAQPSLTPEQEKEYAEKLHNIVKNRPGVVNA
jgi:hypothetical protein